MPDRCAELVTELRAMQGWQGDMEYKYAQPEAVALVRHFERAIRDEEKVERENLIAMVQRVVKEHKI